MNETLPQFLSLSLPIMVTLFATFWISSRPRNKVSDRFDGRFDDFKIEVNRRFDDLNTRLDRIERKLDDYEERLVRLRRANLGNRTVHY